MEFNPRTDIDTILVTLIDPSPNQSRRRFVGIEDLARSIKDLGLIEPIVVRPSKERWELIAGERRLRATKFAGLDSILAIKRDVDDSTARRMTLEENVNREDLTKIEEIDAWILHIDAELWEESKEYCNYAEMNNWPDEFDNQQARLRARWLLGKLNADYTHDTDYFVHKFVYKVESIFSQHPRNVEWRSFLNHDIPLLDLPEPVQEMAIEKNLNKSQAKALGKVATENSAEAQAVLETGKVVVLGKKGYEEVNIEDASSREIEKAPFRARMKDSDPERAAHVSFNAGDDEWYTPPEYIGAARDVMGYINLDPASTPIANQTIQADVFHTKEDDGLTKRWRGKVWMNPPYASNLIGKFINKLVQHVENGEVTEAIVLVNNATETSWFFILINVASAVCFPVGRVKFWAPNKVSAPLQGQAVVYIGDNSTNFMARFQEFGWTAQIFRQS